MLPLSKNTARLVVPNSMEYLSIAIGFVTGIALKHGFTQTDIAKIEIAVEEAVANVICHAFSPEETAEFTVECIATPIGIEIAIADKGLPFDPTSITPYSPNNENLKGIGSHLMKNFMDSVSYRNLGCKGKETHLIKYFPGRDSRIDRQKVGELYTIKEASPDFTEKRQKPISVQVRRIKEYEAIEIARMAYYVYGYTYVSEHIYFPDRIIAMDKTNQLISCLGLTNDDKIAGYVAVISHEEFPAIAELGAAMTHPDYRGRKVLDGVVDFAIKEALSCHRTTLYAQATTAHPYSQPILKRLGYTPWGFMLSYISPMLIKQIDDDTQKRHSVVVAGKIYDQAKPANIFIPKQHKSLILSIYAEMGIKVKEPRETLIQDKSVFTTSVNATLGMGKIVVNVVGKDIIHILKQEITKVKRQQLVLCDLYINMCDCGCKLMFDRIESIGFFFTGILPGSAAGDFAALQYFNGIDVDFELIKLSDGFGHHILKYLQKSYTERFLKGDND